MIMRSLSQVEDNGRGLFERVSDRECNTAFVHFVFVLGHEPQASSTLRRANTGPTVITLEEEEERKVESLYWILIIFRIKYILI